MPRRDFLHVANHSEGNGRLHVQVKAFIREILEEAVRERGVAGAARYLDINRTHFYSLARRVGASITQRDQQHALCRQFTGRKHHAKTL